MSKNPPELVPLFVEAPVLEAEPESGPERGSIEAHAWAFYTSDFAARGADVTLIGWFLFVYIGNGFEVAFLRWIGYGLFGIFLIAMAGLGLTFLAAGVRRLRAFLRRP